MENVIVKMATASKFASVDENMHQTLMRIHAASLPHMCVEERTVEHGISVKINPQERE
jgi:hypothetical protein